MKPPVFIDVVVEDHAALPGVVMRWRTLPGAIPRAVSRVRYEPERGPEGDYTVSAPGAQARVVEVEDSSAGVALLVYGGAHGLRLRLGDIEAAEPYLVLAREAVLE